MQNRSSTFLRLFLNRFHKGALEAVLAPLAQDEAQAVSELTMQSDQYEEVLSAPFNVLNKTHYSWLIEPLEKMPSNFAAYLMGLIHNNQAEKIKHALNIKGKTPVFSPLMKKFVMSYLAEEIPFKEMPPFAFIPESPLKPLAFLKKQELVQLIDFLGLYDLAEEIHNIVDKNLLQKINNALTAKKRSYARQCLFSKEKLVTNRLNLEYWDGDPEKLSRLLHHRGIVRLGYALCGQDDHLIWYITHILDSGRGKKLLRYINEKEISGVTKTLREQVLDVIAFFKKASKK